MAEAQNGANGHNGMTGRDGRDAKSDPTPLTTDQIMREIQHLRELLESRLDHVDSRFEESDKAVNAALESSHKAVIELEASITRRLESARDVTEAKYVTYRTLLDSNADKVAAALAGADKAVSAAFASSKEAITKAEVFNEKRFDILTKSIDELKTFQASAVGKGIGGAAVWGYVLAGVLLIISVVTFVNGNYGGG